METMPKMGLVTFDAWALDGHLKVFRRTAVARERWPQVLLLVAIGTSFLCAARLSARRWDLA
jgi:ABC-2 type transport system permease protein